ncbi:MAG: hypothetical protein L3K07_04590 [Thermoplasmata archaeon]|nr:hypothetical protein [Thermoplasmata archaeon]
MSGSRHLRALLLFLLLAIVVGGIAYPLAQAGIGTLLHAPAYPQPAAPPAPAPTNTSSTNSTVTPRGSLAALAEGGDSPALRPTGPGAPPAVSPNERLLYEGRLGVAGVATLLDVVTPLRPALHAGGA